MKVIIPKGVNERAFVDNVNKCVDRIGENIRKDFESSAKDFSEEKRPAFKATYKRSDRRVSVEVWTEDTPYAWVSAGTDERYVIMTADFRAKTRVGVIPSRGGRGGVLRATNEPQPGIEGREFDKQIAEKQQPKFEKLAMQYIKKAVRESRHSI